MRDIKRPGAGPWLFLPAAVLLGSCIRAAEPPQSAETAPSRPRENLYRTDFEDGRGVYRKGETPFRRHWVSNFKEARLAVEGPRGEGNGSKGALACRTGRSMPYVSCELPLHGTLVEPQGWDGGLSFRIYNGGFERFYAVYLPIVPSDVTFHRAYFDAPEGEWKEHDLPLDGFLYHGRRPRRGCKLEYIVFVAEGPRSDEAVFQLDDVALYRVRRAEPPVPVVKPPLPEGVLYRQGFDDPHDFDLESYYPCSKNANAFRVSGGAGEGRGCLKLACYAKNEEFRGGRRIGFPGDGTVIEFDVLLRGASDFGVVVRSRKGKWRQYPRQPPPGEWTHVSVSAEDFAPYGTPSREGARKKLGRGQSFFALFFTATSDGSGKSSVLIDNLVVRRASVAAGEKGQ